MMSDLLLSTYTIVLPVALSCIMWYIKKINQEKKALDQGVKLGLEYNMIMLYTTYSQQAGMPMFVYQHFMDMYDVYVMLGGDGIAKIIKIEMENIPIVSST